MSYTQRPLMNTGKVDVNNDIAIIDQPFQFGWCLQCTNEYHRRFSPRFLHPLILRLAFNHALPKSQDNPHDQRCTIWSTGIMWWSGYGVNTLVELVNDRQCVILLMSSLKGLEDKHNMISDRRAVITDILSIQQEFCPSLQRKEFVIHPTEIQHYPIDKPSSLLLYDIEVIASSIIEKKPCVTSFTKDKGSYIVTPLTTLLPLEHDKGQDISVFVGRDIESLKLPDGHKLPNSSSPVGQSHSAPQDTELPDSESLSVPDGHKLPLITLSDDIDNTTDPSLHTIDDFEFSDQLILSQAPHPIDVFNLLKVKAVEWNDIGREFKVSFGFREELMREGIMNNAESKLERVLYRWVQSECSDVTWNKVIEVLRILQFNDLIEPTKDILKYLSESQAKKIATTTTLQHNKATIKIQDMFESFNLPDGLSLVDHSHSAPPQDTVLPDFVGQTSALEKSMEVVTSNVQNEITSTQVVHETASIKYDDIDGAISVTSDLESPPNHANPDYERVTSQIPTSSSTDVLNIIRKYRADILDKVSSPQRFAEKLSSKYLITSIVPRDMLTTMGISDYEKTGRVMNAVEGSFCAGNVAEKFVTLCDTLKEVVSSNDGKLIIEKMERVIGVIH